MMLVWNSVSELKTSGYLLCAQSKRCKKEKILYMRLSPILQKKFVYKISTCVVLPGCHGLDLSKYMWDCRILMTSSQIKYVKYEWCFWIISFHLITCFRISQSLYNFFTCVERFKFGNIVKFCCRTYTVRNVLIHDAYFSSMPAILS